MPVSVTSTRAGSESLLGAACAIFLLACSHACLLIARQRALADEKENPNPNPYPNPNPNPNQRALADEKEKRKNLTKYIPDVSRALFGMLETISKEAEDDGDDAAPAAAAKRVREADHEDLVGQVRPPLTQPRPQPCPRPKMSVGPVEPSPSTNTPWLSFPSLVGTPSLVTIPSLVTTRPLVPNPNPSHNPYPNPNPNPNPSPNPNKVRAKKLKEETSP